jgi:hypothetical protein
MTMLSFLIAGLALLLALIASSVLASWSPPDAGAFMHNFAWPIRIGPNYQINALRRSFGDAEL